MVWWYLTLPISPTASDQKNSHYPSIHIFLCVLLFLNLKPIPHSFEINWKSINSLLAKIKIFRRNCGGFHLLTNTVINILCLGKSSNFNKMTHAQMQSWMPFGTPYDYSSIMHFSSYAFTKNKKPTITDKYNRVRENSKLYIEILIQFSNLHGKRKIANTILEKETSHYFIKKE